MYDGALVAAVDAYRTSCGQEVGSFTDFTEWLRAGSKDDALMDFWSDILCDMGFRYLFGLYCEKQNLGPPHRLCVFVSGVTQLSGPTGRLLHSIQCQWLPEMWLCGHTRYPFYLVQQELHMERLNATQLEHVFRNFCVQRGRSCDARDRAHEKAHAYAKLLGR